MPERKRTSDEGPTQLRFPELIDLKTLASLLSVNERYVRRMIAEGRLEYIKVGHLVRFDLEKALEFVEARRRPPATAS